MNLFKNSSLKSKLILLNSFLVVLTVLLISYASIYSITSINNRNIVNLSNQIVAQVSQNIDYYSEEMQNISTLANYDYYIQNFVSSANTNADQDFEYTTNISQLFNNIGSSRTDIDAVMVVRNDGKVVSNIDKDEINPNYSFTSQSWFEAAQKSQGFVMVPPHRQSYIKDSSNMVISFVQQIRSYDSGKSLGAIIIDLNLNALEKICSSVHFGNDGYTIIVDKNSNVIYHPDYSYMYREWDEMYAKEVFKADDPLILNVLQHPDQPIQKNFGGRNLLLTSHSLDDLNWIIIGVYPQDQMMQEQMGVALLITLIGLVIAGIGILCTMFISSLIFGPINNLQKRMKRAEEGILPVAQAAGYSSDEIGSLNNSFDAMMGEIQELLNRVKNEERQKRKAELKFLQAQINPHFLYNTLDSIIWMAESNHKDIVPMTENLAKLFRISISGGRDIVTVREEIDHVLSYLNIQKMRYSKKMDFKIDVSPDIMNYQTLKLILQPIVENAIYHGIKNMRNKGNILIKGMRVLDSIVFQVMDDGVGIEKEKLENILSVNPQNKSGVGIKNVNERIKLYYGENYGLEINSERGIGTVVDVWLPALPFSENPDEN